MMLRALPIWQLRQVTDVKHMQTVQLTCAGNPKYERIFEAWHIKLICKSALDRHKHPDLSASLRLEKHLSFDFLQVMMPKDVFIADTGLEHHLSILPSLGLSPISVIGKKLPANGVFPSSLELHVN